MLSAMEKSGSSRAAPNIPWVWAVGGSRAQTIFTALFQELNLIKTVTKQEANLVPIFGSSSNKVKESHYSEQCADDIAANIWIFEENAHCETKQRVCDGLEFENDIYQNPILIE